MGRLKYRISVLQNSLEVLRVGTLQIPAPNSTEPLNYSLAPIIIHKDLIFGHMAVLLPTFLRIRRFSTVNQTQNYKCWVVYSSYVVPQKYKFC